MTGSSRRHFLAVAAGLAALAAPPRWALGRAPRRGGVLRHVGIEPASFDIHAPASYHAQLASSFVRRGLFKFVNGSRFGPSDFTLVPDLAVGATVSADGRLYTITLRRGARWERRAPVNGREVVAEDVKYSLERALAKSPHACLLGPVEGIEASGAHTVRVRLRHRFAPFLRNLAEPCHAVLPREVEDRLGDFRSAASLIGCGPFQLERYEPGVKAVFSRNPDYYRRGYPLLDRVDWILLKDRPTQLSLFQAGEVDIPSYDGRVPSADLVPRTTSGVRYPLVHWDRLGVRFLAMRTDKPPWSDARVRRALSLAVDRETWVRRQLDGLGSEDGGPVPPPFREWRLGRARLGDGARSLDHDPATARQLLAEAGFPGGLRAKCTSWSGDGPEHGEALALLAGDLRQVGVELVVAEEDDESHARGSFLGRYDETAWDWSPPFSDVDSYLYAAYRSGLVTNTSHVADPRLDALLEAQRSAATVGERKRAIDEIQRRATAGAHYLYAPVPRSLASWTPRVRNYAPRNSLDRGAQLEEVWLDRT